MKVDEAVLIKAQAQPHRPRPLEGNNLKVWVLPESQGQNLAVTALCLPLSLDSSDSTQGHVDFVQTSTYDQHAPGTTFTRQMLLYYYCDPFFVINIFAGACLSEILVTIRFWRSRRTGNSRPRRNFRPGTSSPKPRHPNLKPQTLSARAHAP